MLFLARLTTHFDNNSRQIRQEENSIDSIEAPSILYRAVGGSSRALPASRKRRLGALARSLTGSPVRYPRAPGQQSIIIILGCVTVDTRARRQLSLSNSAATTSWRSPVVRIKSLRGRRCIAGARAEPTCLSVCVSRAVVLVLVLVVIAADLYVCLPIWLTSVERAGDPARGRPAGTSAGVAPPRRALRRSA